MTLTRQLPGAMIAAALVLAAAAGTTADVARPQSPAANQPAPAAGADDFDFLVGEWRVHHRVRRQGSSDWIEIDGTCRNWPLMGGTANVENHTFNRAAGVTYGTAIRAFDAASGEWAIWWIDSRVPHRPMDPPVKGRFKDGVGLFYSDFEHDGKPMRVRFTWSEITPASARWEQAHSADGGKSWEPNWIMQFRRAPSPK